jgi:hypothetical protein
LKTLAHLLCPFSTNPPVLSEYVLRKRHASFFLLWQSRLLFISITQRGLAAADINIVRGRANASPVAPGDVDIDYILDERARELIGEEHRRVTLSRTGKLVERTRALNLVSGPTIKDHNGLFPIPQDAIDANQEAVLEQNPGY